MGTIRKHAVGVALVLAMVMGSAPVAFAAGAPDTATGDTGPEANQHPVDTISVPGFRSAQFGMTEAQVRQAIATDFKIAPKDILKQSNDAEKTNVIQINVGNLLPTGGMATISYIFGYQSPTLIQINIVWGQGAGKPAAADVLINTANTLRQFFQGKGYNSQTMVINGRAPDGSIIVFRGTDREGRMTVLILTGEPQAASKAARDGLSIKPTTLQLSYIKDTRHPDVFKIAPDAF